MATEALLQVKNRSGEIILKIVVGDNGYNMALFGRELRKSGLLNFDVFNVEEIYELACAFGPDRLKVGCSECLVVKSDYHIAYKGKSRLTDNYYDKQQFKEDCNTLRGDMSAPEQIINITLRNRPSAMMRLVKEE
jgi:hypothetical protein